MNTFFIFTLMAVTLLANGCDSFQYAFTHTPIIGKVTSAPPSTGTMSQRLTYNNHAFGFALQYPADWTVDNVQQPTKNSGSDALLTGIFAISKRLPTKDQYGEPMNELAHISISVEQIPGVDIQSQEQELATRSNYTLSGLEAHRDVEDGPNTIYTIITFIQKDTLFRLTYSWSALDGAVDPNAKTAKQQILGEFNTILTSLRFDRP